MWLDDNSVCLLISCPLENPLAAAFLSNAILSSSSSSSSSKKVDASFWKREETEHTPVYYHSLSLFLSLLNVIFLSRCGECIEPKEGRRERRNEIRAVIVVVSVGATSRQT